MEPVFPLNSLTTLIFVFNQQGCLLNASSSRFSTATRHDTRSPGKTHGGIIFASRLVPEVDKQRVKSVCKISVTGRRCNRFRQATSSLISAIGGGILSHCRRYVPR